MTKKMERKLDENAHMLIIVEENKESFTAIKWCTILLIVSNVRIDHTEVYKWKNRMHAVHNEMQCVIFDYRCLLIRRNNEQIDFR